VSPHDGARKNQSTKMVERLREKISVVTTKIANAVAASAKNLSEDGNPRLNVMKKLTSQQRADEESIYDDDDDDESAVAKVPDAARGSAKSDMI
jgi:hypothetical protein